MDKVILIRQGEIFLKGRNKRYFVKLLKTNIIDSLSDFDAEISEAQNMFFISGFSDTERGKIIERLKKICGVYSLSVAERVKTDTEEIKRQAALIAPDTGTFRVSVTRADKTLPFTSPEIAAEIGGYILEQKPQLKVNLYNADADIRVDIRENGYTYIYTDKILGQGGMPSGSSGKGMLLLSGGIDSPVAGYRMAKRGMRLDAIHFHSFPYTSERAKQKVADLAGIVSAYSGNITLCVVPFTEIQQAIHICCRADYMITVMRRIMITIAEKVAEKRGAGALITGESLGQVASQTLESICVTDDAAENIPIFRPLIGTDKEEITAIAVKIDTYETSILPYEDCCTIFLPKNPVIKPHIKEARREQEKIENLDVLIAAAIDGMEYIEIKKS